MDINRDVFESWKSGRFVVVNWTDDKDDLLNTSGHVGKIVVLTDFSFWVSELDSLIQWCSDNNCRQKGMTIEFDNDDQLLLFCLRWS